MTPLDVIKNRIAEIEAGSCASKGEIRILNETLDAMIAEEKQKITEALKPTNDTIHELQVNHENVINEISKKKTECECILNEDWEPGLIIRYRSFFSLLSFIVVIMSGVLIYSNDKFIQDFFTHLFNNDTISYRIYIHGTIVSLVSLFIIFKILPVPRDLKTGKTWDEYMTTRRSRYYS